MDPIARSRPLRRRRVSVRTPSEEDAYETDVPLSPPHRRSRRRSILRGSIDADGSDEPRLGRGVFAYPAAPGTPNTQPCSINIGQFSTSQVPNPVATQAPIFLPGQQNVVLPGQQHSGFFGQQNTGAPGQQNVLISSQPGPTMYHFLPQLAPGGCFPTQPRI
ncbi:hypothetical protein BD289DRAFT_487179, partial [Coniella lustricola]